MDYRSTMEIKNSNVILQINLSGGAYYDFHFKDMPVNPINWRSKNHDQPPFMGHFLCFDRWGPPSNGEKKNGFPHHGEVNTVEWKLLTKPKKNNGFIEASMMCSLPMGKLELKRKIELSENEPVFIVNEEIKNLNKFGRMFNIVQHVTLAPPFLDKSTLFNNNTEKGFENKEDGTLNQEEPVLRWPEVIHNGEIIHLRQFLNEWPRVSSFVFNKNDYIGWATACNTKNKLLLGYVWKREDYPWINFWRFMEEDIPLAFGIEFGTTGLHEAFPVVAKKGKIFNHNIYDFIDANEELNKSFLAFLAKIPGDYKGVRKIEINGSLLTIKEESKFPRDITYHLNENILP